MAPADVIAERRPARVLAIDDSDDEYDLIALALARVPVPIELRRARDGVEALDLLRAAVAEGTPLPELILLDLNMPRMTGFELLEQAKADPALRHLPVVVLSTSSAPADVVRSYRLCAASYVVKPIVFADLVTMLTKLVDYWFRLVKLPGRG